MEHPQDRADTQGEPICLGFTNTVEWHASALPIDRILTYGDLVSWAKDAGLLSLDEAQELIISALDRHAEATATLARAKGLREAIYGTLSAAIEGRQPEATDLEVISREASKAARHQTLTWQQGVIRWIWTASREDLDQIIWPVATSAMHLLGSGLLARVKRCADDRGCGRLFLDRSKNRTRRWCSMRDCGNRAKAKRFYEKRRPESTSA